MEIQETMSLWSIWLRSWFWSPVVGEDKQNVGMSCLNAGVEERVVDKKGGEKQSYLAADHFTCDTE